MTASAGLYGHLLRICRPVQDRLGSHLHSGLISIGPIDDPEAWYVYWRASQFLESSQVSTNGIGLRILNTLSPKPPTLEFLEDRWPVISYETNEGFTVTVRLWCQNNLVVQQIQVTNTLNAFETLKLELNPNFSLQDLDYQEKRDELQIHRASGPHGYGIITLEDATSYPVDHGRMCVILGLFKEGEAQQLSFDQSEGDSIVKPISLMHEFKGATTVKFTVALKLQMSKASAEWKDYMIPPEDLIFNPPIDAGDDQTSSLSDDPVLSWHLRRNLEHILSVCSIPLNSTLARSRPSSAPVDTENNGPSITIQGIDRPETFPNQSEPFGDEPEHAPGPMITLQAPDGKEDILHRSAPSQNQIGPVALTCGDFGDHRISVSGS